MAEDHRRKQLLYRANHRGIKEMDLILGGFATARLDGLSAAELDGLETIMAENDRDLLIWFTGEQKVPARLDTPLFHAILEQAVAANRDGK
ncbi:MAG: succinate dehydrogenase assembly factor 2 [Nitratireductor sp.]|nr:succinate dehydrogenase assembly factor 2 [Nitratireductor sp.]